MNIYVTGGSGFLGRSIIEKLEKVEFNGKIHSLDINNIGHSNFIEIDISKKDSFSNISFKTDDIVIHAAARIFNNLPRRSKRKVFFESVNLKGTKNLVNKMKLDGARKLIFISTDMTYGKPIFLPINEKHPQKPLGEYGESKLLAESFILDEIKSGNIVATIFRPRVIMGSGRLGLFQKLFKNIKNNLPVPIFGNGENRYQFISVDDFSDAIIKTIEMQVWNEIFNIGSDNSPRVIDLLRELIKINNSSAYVAKLNSKLLKYSLNFLDYFNISPMYPEQFLIADADFTLDTNHIKRVLNWHPLETDLDILQKAYLESLKV